jgi:hypothetical protein
MHILSTHLQPTICLYKSPLLSGTVRLLIILIGFYHIKLHVFMFAMAERWIINYKL